MAKLSLTAAPTFKAGVAIPVAGGAAVEVEFTFKHRTKKELEAFVTSREDKTDAESFMEMVVGWELDDPFNTASVELLLQNYIGAAIATYRAYMKALVEAREKN
jgi:hypothetical protein